MRVYQATQAGANDFTGATAATGRLDFTAHYNFGLTGSDVCPVLYNIHVTLAAAAAGRIIVRLTDGTYYDILADNGAAGADTSWSADPNWKRPVWRDGTNNPWRLEILTTKGGAGDGHASVHWRPERVSP